MELACVDRALAVAMRETVNRQFQERLEHETARSAVLLDRFESFARETGERFCRRCVRSVLREETTHCPCGTRVCPFCCVWTQHHVCRLHRWRLVPALCAQTQIKNAHTMELARVDAALAVVVRETLNRQLQERLEKEQEQSAMLLQRLVALAHESGKLFCHRCTSATDRLDHCACGAHMCKGCQVATDCPCKTCCVDCARQICSVICFVCVRCQD